jgi:hypothetical protein
VQQLIQISDEPRRSEKWTFYDWRGRSLRFWLCGAPSGSARNTGDFTRWKGHDAYQKALDRLLRDLRVETA